jgi:hypothetical protein
MNGELSPTPRNNRKTIQQRALRASAAVVLMLVGLVLTFIFAGWQIGLMALIASLVAIIGVTVYFAVKVTGWAAELFRPLFGIWAALFNTAVTAVFGSVGSAKSDEDPKEINPDEANSEE